MRSEGIQGGGIALIIYAACVAAAYGWAGFEARASLFLHPEPWLAAPWPYRWMLSGLLGIILGLIAVRITQEWAKHDARGQELHREFRACLGQPSHAQITQIAISSALAEECLFRGAMLPSWGWAVSTVAFGVVHMGRGKVFWPWTLWALLMGALLGGLFALTGVLLGPMLAHAIINYANLFFLRDVNPDRALILP